ncbi:hypothetical protein F5Y09DRAFT_323950 [Xylaria sp. FL1042]|nr:hypothetical protein F5Y09DRAFT_323950 [Xylaria sp. FL1042]
MSLTVLYLLNFVRASRRRIEPTDQQIYSSASPPSKMGVVEAATEAAAAAAAGVVKAFRTGTKQVFLPAHVVTFLSPRPNQPATFATFKVPRTFNKFDIRDYLLHAYKTPVVGVRSQLVAQPRFKSKTHGRLTRKPPIKLMTVELAQPFVWPRLPPTLEPWRRRSMVKAQKMQDQQREQQDKLEKTGFMALRDNVADDLRRTKLREEAKRLLKEGGWTNRRDLDVRFTEKGGEKKS